MVFLIMNFQQTHIIIIFLYKGETIYCLNHCHIHQNNINLNELLPHPEFKVSDHDFNLYGTCNQCKCNKGS